MWWLGKSAATQARLSPTAQCCCGIGNLLWLRKIMGICFSKPKKSQTKFRGGKKVLKQLILLEKLLAFSYICHNFLWYFLVLWSEKLSFHVYYCFYFFRVAGGTLSISRCTKEQQGKDYFSDSLESFPGDHRLKSFFFRILQTYGYHTQEETGIPLLDWESKKLLSTLIDTEQSKLHLSQPEPPFSCTNSNMCETYENILQLE